MTQNIHSEEKFSVKYIVKDFSTKNYYCGKDIGWSSNDWMADHFDSLKEAKNFIKQIDGFYQIESIYMVKKK